MHSGSYTPPATDASRIAELRLRNSLLTRDINTAREDASKARKRLDVLAYRYATQRLVQYRQERVRVRIELMESGEVV